MTSNVTTITIFEPNGVQPPPEAIQTAKDAYKSAPGHHSAHFGADKENSKQVFYITKWEQHDHVAGFAKHGPAASVLSNQAKVADQKKTVNVAFQSQHGDESHKKIWKAPVTAIVYVNIKPGVSITEFEKGIQASKAVADSGASGLVSFDAGPVVGNPNEWVVAAGYSSLDAAVKAKNNTSGSPLDQVADLTFAHISFEEH